MQRISYELGQYAGAVDAAWSRFCDARIFQRIWDSDHTVWHKSPNEIVNRLGWLDCPQRYRQEIRALNAFAGQVCDAGITDIVLLGMGGSSIGAEVFAHTFGSATGYPALTVLGTTDPQAIDTVMSALDFATSLFIVSTKSGDTVETLSLFKYCYNQVGSALGYENAGQHFVAITDPGSKLEELASELHFRKVWRNDPDIGGRYSVLSYFGLVPAALLGIDLDLLLDRAESMAGCSEQDGAYLGVVLGALAKQGRNKLTICCSPKLAALGPWLEQLIAESSGKHGSGVLPVLADRLESPERLGDDSMYVCIGLEGEQVFTTEADKLIAAGCPVIQITLADEQCLGAEFFRWQMVTACLCHVLGVNPFDQPDVEQAKLAARRIAYGETQHSSAGCTSLEEAAKSLLDDAAGVEYMAVLAYLNPSPGNKELLGKVCNALRRRVNIPVTLGFGPRYLHSTGQLHKGGFKGGRFLIITADDQIDLPIPDQPGAEPSMLSFSQLKQAQALGDAAALRDAGRQVSRVHLEGSIDAGLHRILKAITDLPESGE